MGVEDLQSNEIQRFELLRNELIELEKRVQRSADQAENEEVSLSVCIDNFERDLLIILWLSYGCMIYIVTVLHLIP